MAQERQNHSCDVSTKLKNLKATHNEGIGDQAVYNAVMYPQS